MFYFSFMIFSNKYSLDKLKRIMYCFLFIIFSKKSPLINSKDLKNQACMVISELFLYFIGLTPKKHLLSSLKDMQAPLRQLVWLFLMFLPIYVAFFSLWTFCIENCRMAKLQKIPISRSPAWFPYNSRVL